jgi:hypothetical protein
MRSLGVTAFRLKGLVDSEHHFSLIPQATIDAVSRAVGYRGRRCFWTPGVIVWTFLRQILNSNCACREAVSMTISGLLARDAERRGGSQCSISGDPSAYAQARGRLPLKWFELLHRRVADDVCGRVGDTLRWCGRCVRIIDGSTLSMSDTPTLQAAFPQPHGQKPGCGFPQLRLVAIFCHASSALLDLTIDSLRTQELPLLRRVIRHFQPGDVVVADRAYQSYADVVEWQRHGIDALLRLNEASRPNLQVLRRLGHNDTLMVWRRPKNRIRHLSPEQWAALPESMSVRQVEATVAMPGFRTRHIKVLTTMLDDVEYSAESIAELYRDRWMAELNLRSLKTTLKMEVLRGKSPDIIRKEVYMYAVTYNLIRSLMWQAARIHDGDPRRLSFAGAQQRIAAMAPYMERLSTDQHSVALIQRLIELIAADKLPNRPGRIEPRAVKRRPKSYLRLTRPRAETQAQLRQFHAA